MIAKIKVQEWYCRPCKKWIRSLYDKQFKQNKADHLTSRSHLHKVEIDKVKRLKKQRGTDEGPG